MRKSKLDLMDEMHGVIEALKDSVEGKQKIICLLLKDCIEKDEEIARLRGRVEFFEKWARWKKEGMKK